MCNGCSRANRRTLAWDVLQRRENWKGNSYTPGSLGLKDPAEELQAKLKMEAKVEQRRAERRMLKAAKKLAEQDPHYPRARPECGVVRPVSEMLAKGCMVERAACFAVASGEVIPGIPVLGFAWLASEVKTGVKMRGLERISMSSIQQAVSLRGLRNIRIVSRTVFQVHSNMKLLFKVQ